MNMPKSTKWNMETKKLMSEVLKKVRELDEKLGLNLFLK